MRKRLYLILISQDFWVRMDDLRTIQQMDDFREWIKSRHLSLRLAVQVYLPANAPSVASTLP